MTLDDVRRVARSVRGGQEVADGFMVRRLVELGDRTPEAVTHSGEDKRVIGLLLNIAGR